ncbi:putative membrane protein YdjX (TVP38/TMEM64 family) [Peribacillus deserti]|uniref:TVP38/TMEM64 family membrane protein n=1 Tax=Peribacillus deserti TaxID=673318 RepID=A0ABS2QH72_9BACI|nr:VTT domain-containing protein [Peribacillus deserti]MBM7692457.1 putative membrane protein YdjX (TVP38/TMEM64 family) [Peribacillus deserti]
MEYFVVTLFSESGAFAYLISLALSIVVSILGVVPSVFITAANISYFGFAQGLYLSIAGEALGAVVSFYLYRKGISHTFSTKNKWIKKLQLTKGMEAFFLIIALRIFPFIPSGAVTLAGAASKIHTINFAVSSTIGKIPALLIEAYTVKQILVWDFQSKIVLGILSLIIILFLFIRRNHLKNNEKETRVGQRNTEDHTDR